MALAPIKATDRDQYWTVTADGKLSGDIIAVAATHRPRNEPAARQGDSSPRSTRGSSKSRLDPNPGEISWLHP